jgi:putative ABC transport system permease protein
MTFVVAQERTTFPGVPPDDAFVVASYPQLAAAYRNPPLLPTIVLVRGPAAIADAMEDALRQQSANLVVTSRHARYQALRDAPLIAAISTGFGLTMLVAAGYTAIAMVAALTLSAARRSRDQALLRVLGLSAPQGLALTVVEHAPPVLLALLPGLALGIGIAYLLAPGMGLSAFAAAGGADVTLRVDWQAVGLVSLALLLVVSLAIGLATWAARRVVPSHALRIGDD